MTSSGVASSKIKLRSAFQDNLVDLVQVSTTASWFLEPPEALGLCRCQRLFATKAFTGLEPMVTFPKSPGLAHDVNLGQNELGDCGASAVITCPGTACSAPNCSPGHSTLPKASSTRPGSSIPGYGRTDRIGKRRLVSPSHQAAHPRKMEPRSGVAVSP